MIVRNILYKFNSLSCLFLNVMYTDGKNMYIFLVFFFYKLIDETFDTNIFLNNNLYRYMN